MSDRICVECKWYETGRSPGVQGVFGQAQGAVFHVCMRPQERINPVTGTTYHNSAGVDAHVERGTFSPPIGCGMEAVYWEPLARHFAPNVA